MKRKQGKEQKEHTLSMLLELIKMRPVEDWSKNHYGSFCLKDPAVRISVVTVHRWWGKPKVTRIFASDTRNSSAWSLEFSNKKDIKLIIAALDDLLQRRMQNHLNKSSAPKVKKIVGPELDDLLRRRQNGLPDLRGVPKVTQLDSEPKTYSEAIAAGKCEDVDKVVGESVELFAVDFRTHHHENVALPSGLPLPSGVYKSQRDQELIKPSKNVYTAALGYCTFCSRRTASEDGLCAEHRRRIDKQGENLHRRMGCDQVDL